MIKIPLLLLMVLLFCSCASRQNCITLVPTDLGQTLAEEGVKNAEELYDLLGLILKSHCQCHFPEELKERITFGDRVMGPHYEIDKSMCWGKLQLIKHIVDTDQSVLFFAVPDQEPSDECVIVAVFQDNRWFVYWPALAQQTIH